MNTRATVFFDSLARVGRTVAENPGAKLYFKGQEITGFAEDTPITIEPANTNKGETK